MRHSGRAAREEGGMWRERGEKKKICSRRDASVRLGSARLRSARSTGNFQSAFRVSAFEEGGRGREGGRDERVCVTLLADTGGFERKAHKYA